MRHVVPILVVVLAASVARADDTVQQCVDAHGRGQDLRAAGQLSLARQTLLRCAQPACPALIRADCAQWVDELGRQQPTLAFAARDARGRDLPDTRVAVDGVVLAERLDDGAAYDVDPGRHVIVFTHDGVERPMSIVVNVGEKARLVLAEFPAPETTTLEPTWAATATPARRKSDRPRRVRPAGSTAVIVAGAVATVAGAGAAIYGFALLPPECSLGRYTCAAPPGAPVFDRAARAMKIADAGMIVGGVGVAALAAGFIWRAAGSKLERAPVAIAPTGGGATVTATLAW